MICSGNEPNAVWGYLYGIFLSALRNGFGARSAVEETTLSMGGWTTRLSRDRLLLTLYSVSPGRESLRTGGVSDMMERSIKNDVRERREYEELQDCS